MTLDQLRYFLETAKFQHVGKASKSLAISRSAVSHSISLLEEELGCRLFERKGRNIVLTAQGQALQEKSEDLLAQMENLKFEIGEGVHLLAGHYRIAASHFLASELLIPAWSQLVSENKNISAEIYTVRSANVTQMVTSGEVDFGICFSPQDSPEMSTFHLYEGQVHIYVGEDHPLASTDFSAEKLADYGCVLPKAFGGIEICERHPMFEKYGIETNISLAHDNYQTALHRILHSHDWAFIADWVAEKSGKKIVRLNPEKKWEAPYTISAIRRSKSRSLPVFDLLIEKLQKGSRS